MASRSKQTEHPLKFYRGDKVPMRAIRAFARELAERFQPEKIILFGSHAYGTPNEDSDVDILVVMPARNVIDQAGRIRYAIPRPFAMDLLVRTPKDLERRLREGDFFLREIVARGRVLYEKPDARVGEESGSRHASRQKAPRRPPAP